MAMLGYTSYSNEQLMQVELEHRIREIQKSLESEWLSYGSWNKHRFTDYRGRLIEVCPHGATIIKDSYSYDTGTSRYSSGTHGEYDFRKEEEKKRKEEIRRRKEEEAALIAKKKSNYRKVYWARYIQNAKKQNQSG